MRFETIAARGGRDVTSGNRPLTPPLYQTNVFVFDSMAQVEAVWEGKERGFVYGRYGTPNHAMLEAMVAELEGGEAAVACAPGIGVTFVDASDPERVMEALTPKTRAVFVEALSNPLLRVADVEALAARLAGRGVDLSLESS